MITTSHPNYLEFIFKDITYSLRITNKDNNLTLIVHKPLDINFWELSTNLENESKQFRILSGMDVSFVQDYIIQSIQENSYNMLEGEENLTLEFWIEISMGKVQRKEQFKFVFKKKQADVTTNLSDLSDYIKKVERKCDSFKQNLEIRLNDLKKETEVVNNNYFDLINKKIEKYKEECVKELTIKQDEFFSNFKAKLIEDIESKFSFKANYHGATVSNGFININNENYTFSDNNTTIEKISGSNSWLGFRCKELPTSENRYNFSIRIDKTDTNSYIMIGFCLNTHSNSSGYYNSNCLACFYLNNGQIYCPTLLAQSAYNFRAISGCIVSAIIDVPQRMIYFLVNGLLAGGPVFFILSQDDIGKICPCVDIHTTGTKISIINYDLRLHSFV